MVTIPVISLSITIDGLTAMNMIDYIDVPGQVSKLCDPKFSDFSDELKTTEVVTKMVKSQTKDGCRMQVGARG